MSYNGWRIKKVAEGNFGQNEILPFIRCYLQAYHYRGRVHIIFALLEVSFLEFLIRFLCVAYLYN